MRFTAVKTGKKIEDFEGQAPEAEIRLELHDPKENHNKFWHCFVYESEGEKFFIVRHWGRNFTKGQSMVEQLSSGYEATNYANDMANKKKREGYKAQANFLDQRAREL